MSKQLRDVQASIKVGAWNAAHACIGRKVHWLIFEQVKVQTWYQVEDGCNTPVRFRIKTQVSEQARELFNG